MTVHARQLARLCRERLAAHERPPMLQQPQQQQAAEQQQDTTPQDVTQESEQPVG